MKIYIPEQALQLQVEYLVPRSLGQPVNASDRDKIRYTRSCTSIPIIAKFAIKNATVKKKIFSLCSELYIRQT